MSGIFAKSSHMPSNDSVPILLELSFNFPRLRLFFYLRLYLLVVALLFVSFTDLSEFFYRKFR